MNKPRPGERLYRALRDQGYEVFASLPDNWLVDVLRCLDADPEICHIPVTHEAEAVGICVGARAGGKRAAAVIQNSGLLDLGAALTSLAIWYGIPFLMLLSYRGDFGDDRPYQVTQGAATEAVLKAYGIRYRIVDSPDHLSRRVREAHLLAEASEQPVALLLTSRALLAGGP
ncbi:MAG: thiamine pyrophosphate-binding protein [Dehalococcoidia bacterium]